MSSNTILDAPSTVRPGEELDAARLLAYLAERLPEVTGPLTIAQFPGGFSNLTYLVRAVSGREMVLRRPPFGAAVRGGHDMSREYRILSALVDTYGKVPRPILFCDDEGVIGVPFYLMERVPGVILRSRLPPGLDLPPRQMRTLNESLIEALAGLHALDVSAVGLADLGRPDGYTARQVAGWTGRYQAARTDDCPDLELITSWLAANTPAESRSALIHNDFRCDNAILDPADLTRIIAILDWEMATLGDPLSDLGTTLAYWAEPEDPPALRQFGLTTLPGSLSRAEVAARYAQASGREVEHVVFYYVYGLFKNAVIALQIYARFRQGLTRDPRFGGLIQVVRECDDLARRAIEKGSISHLFS